MAMFQVTALRALVLAVAIVLQPIIVWSVRCCCETTTHETSVVAQTENDAKKPKCPRCRVAEAEQTSEASSAKVEQVRVQSSCRCQTKQPLLLTTRRVEPTSIGLIGALPIHATARMAQVDSARFMMALPSRHPPAGKALRIWHCSWTA